MVAWVEPRVPSANLCVEIHVSACFTDCGDVPAFINAMAQRAVHSVFRGDPDEIHLPPGPEGIVRYKKLKLGKNTRQKRRYYLPDLIRWLN